ncbi:MAG: hypothetical protein OQK75_10115 [Gammaproteobacteria bacterium]|nr:hypothetical protein [Gammaproteobacteria bacterium]MCW8988004.1 hypothetical protein [Gammaproteobacteria bacterium]MCW9032005.1 hypothetical protein [Gammaproteobacteria bacterium]
MSTRLKRLSVLFVFLFLAGCGGSSALMKPSQNQNITPASKQKAKIVFMRTSFVSGAVNAELFEIANGKIKFIGSIPMGSKIVHETTPGKKVYMAYGIAADFMLADVRAGKTYYSIVRPNWGTGGFAPTPIRTDGTSEYNTSSPDFKDWVSGTELLEPIPEDAKKWFAQEQKNIMETYKEYWKRFQTKNPNEKAERSLTPRDGM